MLRFVKEEIVALSAISLFASSVLAWAWVLQ